MNHSQSHTEIGNYTKFVIMLFVSFCAMYITMYFNSYSIDHVYFSLTRLYMSGMGIACMALIMWFFMKKMYPNKRKNRAIITCSIVLFVSALFLVRAQKPLVQDVLWMKAMIPHHSIAILTSERADLQDPEVKKLAEKISNAQRQEIEEMKMMIERLEQSSK
ncbi:DUF305 domain-containing protein [Flavobacterium sp. UMI-01]|uniref:DUF305 domain-containing protein n=1 Tax=Flavobacterium sp. UMI-01 TaxID=1441053 RepID=UPI001C7CD8CB|nr:DUF305 domain-containing protein [Flavobacterium sp. UMI-01]GIZ08166.1 hypothetical protein FUMI01_08930 [Flavobacterium sp. UMI-01]